jgi:hypothetical protein
MRQGILLWSISTVVAAFWLTMAYVIAVLVFG